MLESEGTSRMRAQVPFLPPTKGGMVSINPFRRIPNQCENTIDSSAHCYHRQQLRCKNLSVMAARIEQLFNWRVRYSTYRAFPPHHTCSKKMLLRDLTKQELATCCSDLAHSSAMYPTNACLPLLDRTTTQDVRICFDKDDDYFVTWVCHSLSNPLSVSMFSITTDYYMSMAPLVLEESRCIIAESLTNISRNKRDGCTFSAELLSIEEKYPNLAASRHRQNAPLILNFQVIVNESLSQKHQFHNDTSAKWMRPGNVLLLRRQHKRSSDSETSVLACIVPNGNRPSESSFSSSFLSLMVFRREDLDIEQLGAQNNNDDSPLFCVTALTTLISHVRQMEACLRMVKVSFMRKLLGQKNSTHIRFNNSSDDDEEEGLVVVDGEGSTGGNVLQEGVYLENDDTITTTTTTTITSEEEDDVGAECNVGLSGLLAKIPLNETQERAAKIFLDSPKESLVLVQG
jgi:hypothetical protein